MRKNLLFALVTAMALGSTACAAGDVTESNALSGTILEETAQEETAAEETTETLENTQGQEQPDEQAQQHEQAHHNREDFLPMFSYNMVLADLGYDPLEAAAYDYLAFEYNRVSDVDHVLIPYAKIVDIDEDNPEDILLYGDYYLWEFEKQDDTLVAVSGGHCPGIIHLERFGEGENASYSPVGTMDEAFTDEDAKDLFGEYYDRYVEIASDDETRDKEYALVIADYVKANKLKVTKYQFGGEDAVKLPESRLGQ
ncbi:hypothetical protein [Butyrivibrio sp. FCS014]|uniref:hypothetical protein n=1 Tax=Butyrivibrio sp. FCS014 TaxID=1408304 RepID=UPI0004679454|nr:hypothetical protein [Butyrivibrio sp. FCS014]